jgi:hypothetical protein
VRKNALLDGHDGGREVLLVCYAHVETQTWPKSKTGGGRRGRKRAISGKAAAQQVEGKAEQATARNAKNSVRRRPKGRRTKLGETETEKERERERERER